jgi:AAA domain
MSPHDRLRSNESSGGTIRSVLVSGATIGCAPQPGHDAARDSVWQEIFPRLSRQTQIELLALAESQGILYAAQLPRELRGEESDKASNDHAAISALRGRTANLELLELVPVKVRDDALDADQRQAVAKALATPDVFLLRGLPGTGKYRVAAEIVRQAAALDQRVLLTAPSSVAIDRVLETVSGDNEIYAVRLAGAAEAVDTLAPVVRALTLAERERQWNSSTVVRVQADAAARQLHRDRLRRAEPIWPELLELSNQIQALTAQIEATNYHRAGVPDQVEKEAATAEPKLTAVSPFAASYAAFRAACRELQWQLEKAVSAKQQELEKSRQEGVARRVKRDVALGLLQAKQRWQFWRRAWWRALFHLRLASELQNWEDRVRESAINVRVAIEQVQACTEELEGARQVAETDGRARVAAEITRRARDFEREEAALSQKKAMLGNRWRAECERLGPGIELPSSCVPDAVLAARHVWEDELLREERADQFRDRWIQWLSSAAPLRHEDYANVVAGTLTCACPDAPAKDPSRASPAFELLIVLEADRVSERDLVRIASCARRCILVGEPAWEAKNGAVRQRAIPENRAAVAPSGLAGQLPASPFHRLWQELAVDLRRLPYRWTVERGRFRCRFQDVPVDARQWLEIERVADCPEVELHILALPDALSSLAEIVFPPSFSLSQAKAYVYRELEELALAPAGRSMMWVEQSDKVVLQFGGVFNAEVLPCALGSGVREYVAAIAHDLPQNEGVSWQTVRLEFDRAATWDRVRAEQWLARYLDVRDLGRTVELNVAHRMHPDLAVFVSHVLFSNGYRAPAALIREGGCSAGRPAGGNGRVPHVEFVAVPPLRRQDAGPRRDARGKRPASATALTPLSAVLPSTGAGLEVALKDPRHRERLPQELRPHCASGFANHAEAQAIIGALEALARTRGMACPCGSASPSDHGEIAVVALYPGQVELIRTLATQSQVLKSANLSIEFGTPDVFREREYPMVLLSLTRSPAHRAVSFGEDPRMLELALTRARARLILFGDPGALARRGEWTGCVDHLDETASEREHQVVAGLVEYVRGRGHDPQAFQIRESVAP